jgi:geranylgeranyl diphosphate synthase, type II
MLTLHEAQNLIEKRLQNLNLPEEPKELYEPVRYILSTGGKRVRPALVLLGCDLFGGSASSAIFPALAIEIFHNFTLLHDDIMDKSELRRGKPTVHHKWDENTAILSGDVMTMLASRLINESPGATLKNVNDVFTKTAMEVCEGQQYDMNYESRVLVDEKEYLQMIELKTAVLMAASLKIGAMLGGAAEKDAEDLYLFGLNLGIAFQLQDDLLDTYGNQEDFGKKTGMDIIDNKKTILMITALQRVNEKQKEILMKWLTAVDFDPKEKVESVVQIFDTLDVKSITNKMIRRYYEESLENLKTLNRPDEDKAELLSFADLLINRKK